MLQHFTFHWSTILLVQGDHSTVDWECSLNEWFVSEVNNRERNILFFASSCTCSRSEAFGKERKWIKEINLPGILFKVYREVRFTVEVKIHSSYSIYTKPPVTLNRHHPVFTMKFCCVLCMHCSVFLTESFSVWGGLFGYIWTYYLSCTDFNALGIS